MKISYDTSGWYDGTLEGLISITPRTPAIEGIETLTFVPSLIDPRKREVPVLSYLATYTDAAEDGGIACCPELVRHRVINSRRDFLAADPITGEISVAVNQSHFDAAVEQVADGLEAIRAEEVARP